MDGLLGVAGIYSIAIVDHSRTFPTYNRDQSEYIRFFRSGRLTEHAEIAFWWAKRATKNWSPDGRNG
jgi:hypothetical protein